MRVKCSLRLVKRNGASSLTSSNFIVIIEPLKCYCKIIETCHKQIFMQIISRFFLDKFRKQLKPRISIFMSICHSQQGLIRSTNEQAVEYQNISSIKHHRTDIL